MGILRTNTVSGIEAPTPVTGSVLFDGSGDYLSTPDTSQFDFEAGDWTVEGWIYMNSLPSSGSRYTLAAKWLGTGNNYSWICNIFNDSGSMKLNFGYTTNGSTATNLFSNGGPSEAGKWYHIAFIRDSGALRQFVNGGQLSTNSISGTIYNGTADVNVGRHNEDTNYMNGYISNLRILKGTALYTSNFTPPTRELQPIGDTVLLCCNNSTSATAEATGKTITVNGNAAASTFSPGLVRDFTYGTQFDGVTKFDTQGYFVPPSGNTQNRYALGINEIVTNGLVLHLDAGNPFSYPATGVGTKWTDLSGNNNHGTLVNGVSYTDNNRGALVFDGTNDYVENSSPNLGITGDVSATLSCWFYDENTSTSTSQALFVYGNGPSAGDTIAIILQNLSFSAAYNGGQNVYIANNLYTLNGWNNAVITKTPGAVNTTTKLYLNGIQQTITSSSTITPNVVSRIIRVSRWSNEGSPIYFKGRVSNCLIYNRALSAAEVLQNYNALKDRYGHP